jgi:hypothetical protein
MCREAVVRAVDEDRGNGRRLRGIDRLLGGEGGGIIEEEEMISIEDDNHQGTFHHQEDSVMIDDFHEVAVLPGDTVLRLPHEDLPSHLKSP